MKVGSLPQFEVGFFWLMANGYWLMAISEAVLKNPYLHKKTFP
jgi:hypothetical protein